MRSGRARTPRTPDGRGVLIAPGIEAHKKAPRKGQPALPAASLIPLSQGAVVALPFRDARVASPLSREGFVATPAAFAIRARNKQREALPVVPAAHAAPLLANVVLGTADAMSHDDVRLVLKRTAYPETPDTSQAEDQLVQTSRQKLAPRTSALRPTIHRIASFAVPAEQSMVGPSFLVASS